MLWQPAGGEKGAPDRCGIAGRLCAAPAPARMGVFRRSL